MGFDLFQRLALCLREKEENRQQIDHRKPGEQEEHRGIPMLADDREEDSRKRRCNRLVDDEGEAHAVGANARRHQLRQRDPHAHPRTKRVERHKPIQTESYKPTMSRVWNVPDIGSVNLQRRSASGIQIGEGIFEK